MWYKVKFRPMSPLVSDLTSDILWGHLAWAIKYTFSEEKLLEILSAMRTESPPLLCTSLFPEIEGKEYLPALKIPINPDRGDAKKLKKRAFIEKQALDNNANSLTIDSYMEILRSSKDTKEMFDISTSMHNVISRRSGTVIEGGLFSTKHIYFKEGVSLYAYIYCAEDRKFLETLLNYLSSCGFGADKTTGKGRIELESLDEVGQTLFERKPNANAFVCLSLFVPSNGEINLERSFYKTKVKIGRLGEAFANSRPYYKRPLWFLEEGSVCAPNQDKSFYGTVITRVHFSNKNVVHYGFGIPYWIRIDY